MTKNHSKERVDWITAHIMGKLAENPELAQNRVRVAGWVAMIWDEAYYTARVALKNEHCDCSDEVAEALERG